MNGNITIAAVVVTFNRKELLKNNIAALLQQTRLPDKIFIIDNHSTDGTEMLLHDLGYLQNPIIKYIRLPENTGGAGGFHEGIKAAYEEGCDWIWGMDDDAIPDNYALYELYKKVTTIHLLVIGLIAIMMQTAMYKTKKRLIHGCLWAFL